MLNRTDRWNGNTLRRYHHPSRAIVIVSRHGSGGRRLSVIPASVLHVSVQVGMDVALGLLREVRAGRIAQRREADRASA